MKKWVLPARSKIVANLYGADFTSITSRSFLDVSNSGNMVYHWPNNFTNVKWPLQDKLVKIIKGLYKNYITILNLRCPPPSHFFFQIFPIRKITELPLYHFFLTFSGSDSFCTAPNITLLSMKIMILIYYLNGLIKNFNCCKMVD